MMEQSVIYMKLERGKYGRFLPFAANEAKRLLIPYAFVAAVWVIPASAWFSGQDWESVFTKYILATAPSQLWFLMILAGSLLRRFSAGRFLLGEK